MRKKPLSEQVVVVTGASSGLGRAIARGAGERGAKVVVTARNEEALENCVAEIERACSIPCLETPEPTAGSTIGLVAPRSGRGSAFCSRRADGGG